jgi:murein DD-endopeptidase MepM/ murein hydrolase activator NlpD
VEVLDLTPAASVANATGKAGSPALNPGHYIVPLHGVITDVRRWRSATRFHHGTDVGVPEGTPVYASNSGTVAIAEYEGGYGNVVYINHPDGWQTRYAHLSRMLVRPGQTVNQGKQIALSGNTGVGTGAHLHFEIRDSSGNSQPPERVGLSATVGQVW